MTRKYSSISANTTLAASISNTATTMTVATGTASALLGGITLAGGNVDQFTVTIDSDTANEEVVFITAVSSDTFTIQRGKAGSTGVSHSAGATVRHVLSSDDLNYFNTTSPASLTTAKGTIVVGTGSGTVAGLSVGSNDQVLVADSTQATGVKWGTPANGDVTVSGTQTLTNKTLTAPVLTNPINVSPEERLTVSATAATGTVNFDLSTQGMLYYTTNASANFTLNFRGNSTTTLNSILATGDSISAVFLNANGSTAYYPTAFQVDGSSVTPKWAGGTAPAAGNASSIDAYTFTIIKTASATFTVLAGGPVKFA